MTCDDTLYHVREQTGDPTHASVDDVVGRVFERAQNPHDSHQDAHFDEAMAEVVNRYGTAAVRTVIYRVLVEQYPFRTATVDLEVRTIDGVRIGTTASWFLRKLNSQQDS